MLLLCMCLCMCACVFMLLLWVCVCVCVCVNIHTFFRGVRYTPHPDSFGFGLNGAAKGKP